MKLTMKEFALIVITGILSTTGSWFATTFLGAPVRAETAITQSADASKIATEAKGTADSIKGDVSTLKQSLAQLCNDYGQTIYRIDQNQQNIAAAVHATVVVGKSNLDPCKVEK